MTQAQKQVYNSMPVADGILQRNCDSFRYKKPASKRAAISSAPWTVPPIVHDVLRSPGQPLDATTRAFMELRFGHDFSRVRVHTDTKAAQSAWAVNARAYTLGKEVVFGEGQHSPATDRGRRLMAHELAHVVQQENSPGNTPDLALGSPKSEPERVAEQIASRVAVGRAVNVVRSAGSFVHRDLATPEPTPPPATQPDLTEAQITEAIRFNRTRYDEANTRLIQGILGGPVTGRWTRDNILAIAATQEQYGLAKDGKVGPDTFRFIVQEQALEGIDTTDQNCLTMFRVVVHPVLGAATPGPNGTTRIRGHHVVDAQFSSCCNCSEFQYRQYIAGVATGSRGMISENLADRFNNIPGGSLPMSMEEDGMTNCPGMNYGHREQQQQESTTTTCGENRYMDDAGTTDRWNGCTYRGEDIPELTVYNLNSGDTVDLLIQFRGEIKRNGRTIQTKSWTTIDTTVRTP